MLPCDFEHPVEVEPYLILDTLPAGRVVSSSIRALHELQQMNDELQVNDDFEWSDADPLSDVKIAYLQLRQLVEAIVESGLPLIFWG